MKKGFVVLVLSCLAVGAKAQTGTWSGKLDVQGTALPIVFHLEEAGGTMDSPAQGVKGIPVNVERHAQDSITLGIPAINGIFKGCCKEAQITGTFKQHGMSFLLTLTPGEQKLNRPQTPIGPFPYTMEDVSFANGDAVLKGTLVLPEGYSRKTPVLVMVTGSGLQNRDEEIFEHKPFAVIADALARAGIATLRYDDRGFGESTGDAVYCTTEDLKNDALAGIKLLRERFDRVGIIGHSEGGTIGLMLAAEGKVDFVVSLAGMVVSGKELLLWQNSTILSNAGFTPEAVKSYCQVLTGAFDACIAETPFPSADSRDLPDALKQNYQGVVMQLKSPYMRYFLKLDAREFLKKINCPVLALNGSKDTQVDAESNLQALREGLPSSSKTRIETIEGLNHIFQHSRTGQTAEYREIEETFAPEVLEMIIQWMKGNQLGL